MYVLQDLEQHLAHRRCSTVLFEGKNMRKWLELVGSLLGLLALGDLEIIIFFLKGISMRAMTVLFMSIKSTDNGTWPLK